MARGLRRITLVWAVLVAATVVSFAAGNGAGHLPRRAAGAVAIAIAFAKVRFVALDFMELRAAPLALRLFAEAWCLVLAGALIALTL